MAKPTVLVADDNGQVLMRVLSLLRLKFDVVGTATNGTDLIVEAERLRPNVIVSDVVMPILNGIEAAHELLEKRSSAAKFVFLTVHHDWGFVDACFAEGALGYVTKSRMGIDLVAAIEKALSGEKFISPDVGSQGQIEKLMTHNDA